MARAETVRIEGLAELNRALRELPQRIANRGLRTAVYAGAKVLASVSVPNGQNLMLESGDSIEKIIAFYKGQMSAGGWDEKMSMNQGESSVLIYKKEQRQASIVVTRAEKGSQINLTIASDSR